ncbi:MAG: hypothetical protein RLZZ444_279 [Pseudomonadota bacterium]|jgi:transcriptional regulator GlxA family with amidase domain
MADDAAPKRIGILVADGFALMSFASVVEPLRAANLVAGREIYRTVFFSVTGGVRRASCGASIETVPIGSPEDRPDLLFLVIGGDPQLQAGDPALLAALRRQARQGVRIAGVSGGPMVMAAAGLLADHRFTIHWEHAAALTEMMPDLVPLKVRYVIDRDRITCGGGIAPLDLMHELIGADHGGDLAQRVSDWFLHVHVDAAAGPQRASVSERYQVHNGKLALMLEMMEATIERPLSRREIAARAGISERHVDRLFALHLKSGFRAEYLRIRLERARSLLRQSAMPVSEIAFATGFASASHFSRAYRQTFGENPGKTRK